MTESIEEVSPHGPGSAPEEDAAAAAASDITFALLRVRASQTEISTALGWPPDRLTELLRQCRRGVPLHPADAAAVWQEIDRRTRVMRVDGPLGVERILRDQVAALANRVDELERRTGWARKMETTLSGLDDTVAELRRQIANQGIRAEAKLAAPLQRLNRLEELVAQISRQMRESETAEIGIQKDLESLATDMASAFRRIDKAAPRDLVESMARLLSVLLRDSPNYEMADCLDADIDRVFG